MDMPLPEQVDLDKLVSILLDCTKNAISGWLKGVPKDESAFTNRLTGQLARVRRGCDVGLTRRVVAQARVAELHRRAADASDLFGSDLAVTIFINPGDYLKTAMFQVKKGESFSAVLERHQVEVANKTPDIRDRSFVLYIDEERASVRVSEVRGLLNDWPQTQATKTFSTRGWQSLTSWAASWFSCEVSPMSEMGQPDVEERLRDYEIVADEESLTGQIPANPLAWLLFALYPEGWDIAGSPWQHYFEERRPHR
jgi:hypothetical protein